MATIQTSCRYCDSSLQDHSQLGATCSCAAEFPVGADDCAGGVLEPQQEQLEELQDNIQDNQEFFDAMEKLAVGSRDSSIFCYILKQKDEIIYELREKIGILNDQVAVLSEARKDASKKKRNQSPKQVEGRINVKLSKRKLVVGTNPTIQANGKNLKGVPNFVILHVHRTDPNMTAEDLEVLLRNKFPEVRCEQILSRHPDVYSSFKVSILAVNLNEAMDPAIWPEGAYVQRFVNFKKTETK